MQATHYKEWLKFSLVWCKLGLLLLEMGTVFLAKVLLIQLHSYFCLKQYAGKNTHIRTCTRTHHISDHFRGESRLSSCYLFPVHLFVK